MGYLADARFAHYYNCYNRSLSDSYPKSIKLFSFRKHPIKYTIPNITKAAIPIVGYAAFAIYSHSFFHLCGSICSSSSFVAFCIYGILAITSFR